MARLVRVEAVSAVRAALLPNDLPLRIRGSAGQGRWAETPWIAVMDPVVTDTPETGYYIAYLFAPTRGRVALSLQLGTTMPRRELGNEGARAELRVRGARIRNRVPEFAQRTSFSDRPIEMGADGGSSSRTAFYRDAHVFGLYYDLPLPTDERLQSDLNAMIRLYHLVAFRGGFDSLDESVRDLLPDAPSGGEEDARRYRFHRRIERNRSLAIQAKQIHGYTCQACDFDFERVYGVIGRAFIEAHHLVPLAELSRDGPVRLDPRTDFAVLCANCHRMMHREKAPQSILELRSLIAKPHPIADAAL